MNSFSEEFLRRTLSALPLMASGWSAKRLLIIIGRRLERALVIYFAFEGSKIVGWQPEGILLRPEMLIVKSVSLKCNGKILGSIDLCNILSARLH